MLPQEGSVYLHANYYCDNLMVVSVETSVAITCMCTAAASPSPSWQSYTKLIENLCVRTSADGEPTCSENGYKVKTVTE